MSDTGWRKEVIEWLEGRPAWLQSAAKALGASRSLSDEEVREFYEMCVKEAEDSESVLGCDLSGLSFAAASGRHVRLLALGDVKGLNALKPRSPLELGSATLTVVYGENGTGKSGYVRILKQVSGSRDRSPIKPNVFIAGPQNQECSVRYEVDGKAVIRIWTPADGSIEDLREVDIFDTRLGRIVLTEENEVTYEPPVLTFMSDLVDVCRSVRALIDTEVNQSQCQVPLLPKAEFRSTEAGKWYESLSADTSDAEVARKCEWTDQDEKAIGALNERLAAESPADVARGIRRRVSNLQSLLRKVDAWTSEVADVRCRHVHDVYQSAAAARATADLAAKEAFSDAPLDGVGSEPWRALWNHAKAYSTAQAYPEVQFPVVGAGSRCVLCMQELDEASSSRLKSFEEFVRGATENAASDAEATLRSSIEQLGTPPPVETIQSLLDAAAVEDEDERATVLAFFTAVRARHAWAISPPTSSPLPGIPDMSSWHTGSSARITSESERADGFERDAKSADRSGVQAERDAMAAKRWVAAQKGSIEQEVLRLRRMAVLDRAQSLSATTGLSSKKGALAEQLVSEAFIEQFARELRSLAANRIQVELLKTRTERGHTLHRVQLKGLERTDIGEVLSEGEFRVVALAATLADAAIGDARGPFIFDDPISSLDQRFEEAVVQRLVELAMSRQVVVFTHRLSLIALVDEYAKKASLDTDLRCVVREPWGAGEPVETPLRARRPDRAFRQLKDERLAKATKVLSEDGSTAYEPLAKSICSDYRILLERTIEFELLADVVQRHRRAVQTVGKLDKIAKVEATDCDLFDRLMTKYSRYEHSQSLEAPVALPTPDELEGDIDEVLNWIDEFRSR